jgi:hypothetical protein
MARLTPRRSPTIPAVKVANNMALLLETDWVQGRCASRAFLVRRRLGREKISKSTPQQNSAPLTIHGKYSNVIGVQLGFGLP